MRTKKLRAKIITYKKITALLSSHVASSRPIFAELFRGLLSQSSSKHFYQRLGILCILVILVLSFGDLSKSFKIDPSWILGFLIKSFHKGLLLDLRDRKNLSMSRVKKRFPYYKIYSYSLTEKKLQKIEKK